MQFGGGPQSPGHCGVEARNPTKAELMADLLNLVMLIGAAVGSMAFGVLGAYAIFRAGFAMMRPARRPGEIETRREVADVP